MGITHATAATGTDSGDGKISKNAWNEAHDGGVEAINGGKETVSTVAAAGSTETIDLANGNVFDVTLNADCTFTFTGATNNVACSFTLLLRQNGTGGWTSTWPGSVVWAGGSTPTLDETASTLSVLTFFTLDGGTTWYGFTTGPIGQGVGAKVYHSTTQSIPDTTWTAALFDSEEFDTDGFHSTTSYTSRLTVPAGLGGKYLVRGQATWAGNATNTRYLAITKNGNDPGSGNPIPVVNRVGVTGVGMMQISGVLDLAASDYVEMRVYQDSTGSLNIGVAGQYYGTELEIMRLDFGTSTTPSLIHTHSVTTEHTGTSCGGAWTDLSSNTTFTKTRNSSMLRVTGRFSAQARETTSAEDFVCARVVIDSGGTPQYLMLASQLFNDTIGNNYWALQGAATTHLTGLASGSHTVKIQAITGATGDVYLRPSGNAPYEYGIVEIVEE